MNCPCCGKELNEEDIASAPEGVWLVRHFCYLLLTSRFSRSWTGCRKVKKSRQHVMKNRGA
jgi:hypothetical protein